MADAAGRIDAGEEPFEAAKRELWEETNVRSVELIAELPDWLTYDLPEDARGRWSGRYRGQTQKWFLFRFVGSDKEIDVHHPAGGAHDAEFDDWRWERLERLPELVVPFKREVYEAVAAAFAPLARPAGIVNLRLFLLARSDRGDRHRHLLIHLLAQTVVGEIDVRRSRGLP